MMNHEEDQIAKIRAYSTVRKAERTPMELYKEYMERETDYKISNHVPVSSQEREHLWGMVLASKGRYDKSLEKAKPKPPAKLSSIKKDTK